MSETTIFIIFGAVIVIMLLLDLGVFHKKQHIISTKEATIWTIIWIFLGCLFGVFIWYEIGSQKAIEYFSAYALEKSLSLDNVFVFVLIFSFYNIKEINKHKILFWGIMGALIFRAIFIFSGVWLIEKTYLPAVSVFGISVEFNIILIIFGGILIWSGITAIIPQEEKDKDFDDNFVIIFLKKFFKVDTSTESEKFFSKIDGVKHIAPLFLALITIELSDIVFAVDSVSAIFAISKDPIILYTSNIFAILGLRSMFFMLSSIINYFSRLKQGISVLLIIIGLKMFVSHFIHIPPLYSLIIIAIIIAGSIIWSVIEKQNSNKNQYE